MMLSTAWTLGLTVLASSGRKGEGMEGAPRSFDTLCTAGTPPYSTDRACSISRLRPGPEASAPTDVPGGAFTSTEMDAEARHIKTDLERWWSG